MAQTTIQGSFLGDATVTGAKIGADFISAQTDLPSGLSTTDEIIVSDAGVIKRMDISVLEIAATQITASGTLPALNGAALTALTAANITASGTLPALSGVNLTALVAGNITAGGTFLAQDGSALTALTAANLTGALPAISGANLTNLPAITTAKILDANVTLAKIESQAANTVLVRDASSSGVVSAKAVADTQLLIGDGTGFTAATLSGDATLANSGGVTVASSHSGSAHHAQSHTVVSHSDTTATGAELETLTDGSTTALHGHSAPAHTVVSHSDTTATGAELETLTDGSTTALHAHSAPAHNLDSHSTRTHANLQSIGANDHHAQSHAHSSHSGVGANDHHASSHSHGSHSGVGANDHHAQTHSHGSSTHIEGKTCSISSGAACSVTWATAFSSTPVVADTIKRGVSYNNHQYVTVVSTTGATIDTYSSDSYTAHIIATVAT